MRALKLPKSEAPGVRRALKALVDRGALIETRGRHFGVPELMDLAAGRITVHPNGFGFVKLDHPIDEVTGDIYVAGHNLHDAMHGDRVLVRVERHGRDGRAEGRIVRILERGAATTVGRFDKEEHGLQYVTPFDKRLLIDVQVPAGDDLGALPGQMVVIEITRWPVHGRGALGRVIEIIGDLEAPGVDTRIIIRKHGIPDQHSDESIAEATRLGVTIDPKDIEGRTDFRGDVVVTIDGETARDFDDAISVERLENGHYLLEGAHRRRGALRARGQCPGPGGGRARHLGVLPGTGRAHVPGGTRHGPVLAAAARRSPRPVVRDGDRRARPCRRRLAARRRDPEPVAHDLQRGPRHPSGRRGAAGDVPDAGAAFRAHARAVRDPQPAPASPGLDRLRPARGQHRAGRGRADREHPRRGTQRRAPADRGVHAGGQRDGRGVPRVQRRPDAVSHPRGARPAQGRAVRGVHRHARLLVVGAHELGQAEALPEARREAARQARGAADRHADAADDAEGALRHGVPRTFRAGGRCLRALHVAHPPLPGPHRPPYAARVQTRQAVGHALRGACRGTARKSGGTRRRWSAVPTRPRTNSSRGRRCASWPTRSARSTTASSRA